MPSQHLNLKKLNQVFSAFRSSLDGSIPLQLVQTFIVVAENEGKGVNDLSDLVGTNKSTMSRHLLDLSDKLRTGAPGYGILKRSADPKNLRSVHYSVTPKGRLLLNQINDILEN
jgi:DNA-binding MarR family transcriptional regulator